MIKIIKSSEPEELKNNKDAWTREYLSASGDEKSKTKFSERYKKFKEHLFNESHNKCAYCESKFRESYFGDVEHIDPKSVFPDKIYDWRNLTVSCSICNNNKKTYCDENLPLINPLLDEPGEYICAYGPYLTHTAPGNKGESTVSLIDLNRASLLERRSEKLNSLTKLIDIVSTTDAQTGKQLSLIELAKQSADESEYSFISRCYISSKGINITVVV